MQETARPIEPEIVALIERTVRERMGPYALRTIDVRAGEDHDGDPVIYVQVRHDLSETPIDPQVNAKLSFDLWQLLERRGDQIPACPAEVSRAAEGQDALEGERVIVTARRLAAAGRTKPRQSDMKRSVSTAYYALFHAIAKDAADLLVGGGAARADRAWSHVYRGLEHGFAKNACREISKLGFPVGIMCCASEFIELQDMRHIADYDPRVRFTRAEALQWAARAEVAIAGFRTAPRRDRKAFAVQLLLKKRS